MGTTTRMVGIDVDRDHDRVEISFPEKPGRGIRVTLKQNGWRYYGKRQVWHHRYGSEDERTALMAQAQQWARWHEDTGDSVEYANLQVTDLRAEARDRGLYPGEATRLQRLRKAGLVAALEAHDRTGETAPAIDRDGNPLETSAKQTEKGTETVETQDETDANPDPLAKQIAAQVEDYLDLDAAPDPEQVRKIAREVLDDAVNTVEVKRPEEPETVDVGAAHEKFDLLLTMLTCDNHRLPGIWLYGPTGGGKSYAARQAAEALGLEYEEQSVCGQTSVPDLIGYRELSDDDGDEVYHDSAFRRRYEQGGVFVLDEVDAGNPNVLSVLNEATANGEYNFPDGKVEKHDDFRLVATANTVGNGGTREYQGRVAQDAAVLNRFARVWWGYDETLEEQLAPDKPEWVEYVQDCRQAVKDLGLRLTISPRATEMGAELLRAGIDREQVENMVLWPEVAEDTVNKIKTQI